MYGKGFKAYRRKSSIPQRFRKKKYGVSISPIRASIYTQRLQAQMRKRAAMRLFKALRARQAARRQILANKSKAYWQSVRSLRKPSAVFSRQMSGRSFRG